MMLQCMSGMHARGLNENVQGLHSASYIQTNWRGL
jgi:hypothetical protein